VAKKKKKKKKTIRQNAGQRVSTKLKKKKPVIPQKRCLTSAVHNPVDSPIRFKRSNPVRNKYRNADIIMRTGKLKKNDPLHKPRPRVSIRRIWGRGRGKRRDQKWKITDGRSCRERRGKSQEPLHPVRRAEPLFFDAANTSDKKKEQREFNGSRKAIQK